ncbi:MAG: hypothetical protein ACMUJM_20195 [bacterium]
MKRKLCQLTLFLAANLVILLLFSTAMAGVISNPTGKVNKGVFQVGAEVDIMTRDWKDEDDNTSEIKSNRYLVKGAYGINDQWDVFLKLGMGNMTCDENGADFDGDSQLSFGIGGNGTVYTRNQLKVGAGLQIFSTKSEEEENGATTELSGMEIEASCAASYEGLGKFLPYGGFFLSKIEGKSEYSSGGTSTDTDLEEDGIIGLFIGGDYSFMPQMNIGAEVRLINETSFALRFNYGF